MKLSELQDCLERLKCEHGDIDIVTEGMDGIGMPCLISQLQARLGQLGPFLGTDEPEVLVGENDWDGDWKALEESDLVFVPGSGTEPGRIVLKWDWRK